MDDPARRINVITQQVQQELKKFDFCEPSYIL
jgi:hypothetical protein